MSATHTYENFGKQNGYYLVLICSPDGSWLEQLRFDTKPTKMRIVDILHGKGWVRGTFKLAKA